MYICICNAVTDKTIDAAIVAGATSLRELSAQTGVATTCGKCSTEAQRMLDRAALEKSLTPPALTVVA